MTTEPTAGDMRLKVAEIFIEDFGKGLARFGPDDARALGASLGDVRVYLQEGGDDGYRRDHSGDSEM
jgi:hypothetical protein